MKNEKLIKALKDDEKNYVARAIGHFLCKVALTKDPALIQQLAELRADIYSEDCCNEDWYDQGFKSALLEIMAAFQAAVQGQIEREWKGEWPTFFNLFWETEILVELVESFGLGRWV